MHEQRDLVRLLTLNTHRVIQLHLPGGANQALSIELKSVTILVLRRLELGWGRTSGCRLDRFAVES
jgi:hypothetical protein